MASKRTTRVDRPPSVLVETTSTTRYARFLGVTAARKRFVGDADPNRQLPQAL